MKHCREGGFGSRIPFSFVVIIIAILAGLLLIPMAKLKERHLKRVEVQKAAIAQTTTNGVVR
jgi:hypothetical protein